MEPGKTSFFQALGIPTKIARGTIEIVTEHQVLAAGGRVGTSEATLLNMLNISPFTYGMKVVQIYDQGNLFSPDVLDVDESVLIDRFMSGIKAIAAISLAVSIATEYPFEGAEKVKEYLANPEAFAAAAPAAAAESAPAAAAAEEKEEEKEESDDDMGFGLFD